MSHKYSHLIWLGANTATEPANLLSCAQQSTLFEAREAACLALQKQYSEPDITVINALVTATNQTVNFIEYNLPEFSATQPTSGLTKLFPGLKALKSELQNSLAVADVIGNLSLADDNNLLVVDILDSNLTLLKALETSKHLSRFKTIYIQAPQEPLYTGAASHEEIVAFMQTQGYLPQVTTSSDPDLPWLSFIINPLWKTLQQAQQKNRELEAEQAKLKAQLNAAQEELLGNQKTFDQKNLESTKHLQSFKQQIAEQKQQLVNASKQKQETEQQLAAVKQQLSTAQQELAAAKQAAEQTKNEQKQLLDSTTKSKQELEQQLATVKQQLSTTQQELTATKQTAEKTNGEQKQLLDATNKAKQDTEEQLAAVKQQLSAAQQELAAAKQATEQTKSEQKQLLDSTTKSKQELEQQLTTVKQQLSATQQDLTASKQIIEKFYGEHKQILDAVNKAKQDTEQQLTAVKQQLTTAQQELTKTQQQKSEAELSIALEQKIQKMFADQAQQLTKEVGNIKNHVNTGLDNTAKQLEAFMGIQNYLERGVKPLSFHGWPISPDIGLYIAGLIDENNYDVIIEFGSGTSTVLMAKALISKLRGTQTKTLANTSPSSEVTLHGHNVSDLPARIVTFEHNSLYHGKTQKALEDNGVAHLVDLVHAPLVDYQYKDGSQYLYYNCNEKLQELAKIFKGRKANILVLVDGPPGATNKNARFPALPHLLNTLPEHSFTIVMDDYNRPEEKEIVELWKKSSEDRCLNPSVEVIQSEKGLATIRISQQEK